MDKYDVPKIEIVSQIIKNAEKYRVEYNLLSEINNNEIQEIFFIFSKPLDLTRDILWNVMGFRYYEDLTRNDEGYSFSYEFDEYFDDWVAEKITSKEFISSLYNFIHRIKKTYDK